nr:reverse transcriptase domain-containing protein [Tanacetum cinerariifolium]
MAMQEADNYLLTKPFDAGSFQYLVTDPTGEYRLCNNDSLLQDLLEFLTFEALWCDILFIDRFHTAKTLGLVWIWLGGDYGNVFLMGFNGIQWIETTKEGTKILTTVDGKLRTVSESSIRRNLKLNDKAGISSLPDAELFENLQLMGYNILPNQKFTFQKGQFSCQWKYLIHTIMQCLSPKGTGFNEFSSNIATALVCLATNRVYNFSKMIFDGMVKNVDNKVSKFLMYLRNTNLAPSHTLPEAQQTSPTTYSSPTLPPVTTANIPPVIPTASLPTVVPTDTPYLRHYTRRARIAQSSALPPLADEHASPLRDVSQCEACPTDSGFEADQDMANIAKTSTLPSDSAPRVTYLAADEGSMQQKLNELTALCTSLQRQHSEMVSRFEAQELEINSLKARIKLLEDKDRGVADQSGYDAPIKGGDAATVLSSGVAEVSTSSGSIPTAGPPATGVPTGSDVVSTAGLIFATATVVTSYTRRKGKEKMIESETPKKKKIQEQMDIQMAEEDELYRDVNINQGRGLQATLEVEDTHVTLTPINSNGQQESSSVSSQFVTSMPNPTSDVDMESIFANASSLVAPLHTSTPIMTPSTISTITTISQAPIPPTPIPSEVLQNLPTFDSVFRFDDRLKSLETNFSKYRQTNPFAEAVSNIPGIVHRYMNQQMNEAFVNPQLEAEVLTRSSHSSRTSYAVVANLSEMELKKILIKNREGNKSIQRSEEQRNLYKALIDAYEADKIILDSYGETVILKRRRDDDDDQDEGPFAGSDRGSKRWREGKEPESASAPLETATRSVGRSTTGFKSRQLLASESAFAEEPVQTTSHIEEPSHPVFETGAEDQPIVQSSQHPEWFSQPKKPPTLNRNWNKTLPAVQGSTQTWISKLAKQADSRSYFNELLDTPLDFSNFIMNRLRVDTLTLELLARPTYELMKGSCTSLIELEYHLEEEPIDYDKHALWGVPHWGHKRQQFYSFAVNRESSLDVYSKRRIIAVTDLKIVEWHSYKHLDWISVRRDDDKIYKFKECDFKRLRLQDIEDMLLLMKRLNLTKPDTYRSDLKQKEAYTAYSNPRGFIYQNKDKKNRMQYLPQTIWRKGDKDRAADMIQAIDKMLKTKRIMRSLEKFVGGRLLSHSELVDIEKEALSSSHRSLKIKIILTYAGNPFKKILPKLNLSDHRSILTDLQSDFRWTTEAEQAFQQLKQHLSALPLLAAPKPRKELIMYLSATHGAISAVLMTERGTTQTPVYFISRALQGPELNYSPMEKLVLSLVFVAKRLRRYFQAHPIAGQILADFLNEMPSNASQGASVAETQEEPWTLFTDGSSCVDRSGAWLILTNPDGVEFTYALRFQFAALNNEAEYEALIAGLRIATQMGVKNIQANVDSKLVANQVLGTYIAKEDNMIKYLDIAKGLVSGFKTFSISQRPRIIPAEIGMPTYNTTAVDVVNNDDELRLNLDLLEERRELAAMNEARSKSKMMKYYNSRVRGVAFQPGDFVYRSNDASHAVAGGKL